MKKIILLFVFCLSVFFIYGQNKYSQENFKNFSQEELDVYYNKAVKLKKTGGIISVIGFGSIVLGFGFNEAVKGGLGVDTNKDLIMNTAFLMVITGSVITLVGIPITITGAKRVKKINQFINISSSAIKLKPNIQYNSITQNYQSVVTLSIKL